MTDDKLDLSTTSLGTLVHEVDAGLGALIAAADVAEKFSLFLPASVGATLAEAVKILSSVKALVDKLPQ